MSITKWLESLFGGKSGGDGNAFHYAVKCARCGEVVRIRADRRYDLEQDFGGDGGDIVGYALHKEVLGNRCPQLMRVEVRYDRAHREVERSVEGGEFVPVEE